MFWPRVSGTTVWPFTPSVSRLSFIRAIVLVGFFLPWVRAQNWQLDPGFVTAIEASDTVPSASITALGDAEALVVHDGTYVDGHRARRLIRLKANGQLDSSYASPAFDRSPVVVCAYSDNRALVYDGISKVVRLSANGTLDQSFTAVPIFSLSLIKGAIQPDGKVLLWTNGDRIGSANTRLVRLLDDGTIDPDFSAPKSCQPQDLAIQPDGKLVIAGTCQIADGTTRSMARLHPNGLLDTSFDVAATLPSNSSVTIPTVVAVLPGGKIHTGNTYQTWRLLPDGANDASYHPSYATSTRPTEVFRVTSSGTFYFLERFANSQIQVRRLSSDGATDPNFVVRGVDAKVGLASSLDDATLLFSGPVTTTRATARQIVTRVTSTGDIDPTFSPRFSNEASVPFARQSDGKYLVQGAFDWVNGTATPPRLIVRLKSDGSLDPSFSTVATDAALGNLTLRQVQTDGHIWVSTSTAFYRLNSDGALDSSYPALSTSDSFLDQNGTAYSTVSGATVRRSADGSIDPTFSAAPFRTPWATPDGRIICTSNGKLVRLLETGVIDSTYNPALDTAPIQTTTILPDGSFFTASRVDLPDLADGASNSHFRCFRFDVQGNRALIADIRFSPNTLGALLHDLVQAAGGGHAILGIAGNVAVGSSIDVSATGETSIGSGVPAVLNRWIVSPSNGPALSLAPEVYDHSPDTVTSRGSIAPLTITVMGQGPFTYQWLKGDAPVGDPTTTYSITSTLRLTNVQTADAGSYRLKTTNALGTTISDPIKLILPDLPTVIDSPASGSFPQNSSAIFRIVATGPPIANTGLFTYRWSLNGVSLSSSSTGIFTINNFGPTNAGIYTMSVQGAGGVLTLPPAIIGVATTAKVVGSGSEVGPNTPHPNGRIYDQILLEGSAATVTADPDQVTRISFIDLSDDIVQVEFSGAGTLSLVLDSPTGPAAPLKYNQPGVNYMKGHATIVITGADESSNLSVFSVGRANAINQGLFSDSVTYDGIADLALVAIATTNGKFGGIRAGNASFWATRGYTGIYAPGVAFSGPVYLGDIDARSFASPELILGSVTDARVTGGDFTQTNSRAVDIKGIARLSFVDGSTSHGVLLPAHHNQARLQEDGTDVTDKIVNNPAP